MVNEALPGYEIRIGVIGERRRRARAFLATLSVGTLLIAGCSSAAHATGPAPSAQVQAETVGWFFPATVTQGNTALAFFSTLRTLEEGAVISCLDHYAFSGQVSAYATAYVSYLSNRVKTLPGYQEQWSPQLVDVNAVAKSRMLAQIVTGTNSPPSAGGMPAGEVKAVKADFARCLARVRKPVRGFQRDGRPLNQLWAIASGKVNRSNLVRKADRVFEACVTRQDAPAAASASSEQFQVWLGSVVNPPRTSAVSLSNRVSLDAHWTSVWAHCAGPVVLVWQRLLSSAQRQFLQVHFLQVTALEQQVSRSVSKLRQLDVEG